MAGALSMQDMFSHFAKFGDSKADGKTITLTQSDKWMKQAGVIGKKITTTDTGICFNKMKAKTLSFGDYDKFLQDLAKYKSVEYNEIVTKMVSCGLPGTNNATQAVTTGAVDRLTDTSKYTGAHKERFDAEGKGKGIQGREDVTQNDGYVSGYTNKDTYDKTHK